MHDCEANQGYAQKGRYHHCEPFQGVLEHVSSVAFRPKKAGVTKKYGLEKRTAKGEKSGNHHKKREGLGMLRDIRHGSLKKASPAQVGKRFAVLVKARQRRFLAAMPGFGSRLGVLGKDLDLWRAGALTGIGRCLSFTMEGEPKAAGLITL
jgi:hypothetical protein